MTEAFILTILCYNWCGCSTSQVLSRKMGCTLYESNWRHIFFQTAVHRFTSMVTLGYSQFTSPTNACLLTVGGTWRTWREPTQAWEEHTNTENPPNIWVVIAVVLENNVWFTSYLTGISLFHCFVHTSIYVQ